MENKQKSRAKKDGVVQAPFVQKEHRQKRVHVWLLKEKKFVVVLYAFHELLGKAKGCIVLYVGAKKIWAFIHIIM